MTLFPSPISVSRTLGAYNDLGIWVDQTPSVFEVLGSVQPMSAREVQALEPEDREDGQVVVFTDSDLKIATKGSTTDGDVITWQGAEYRLVTKDPFSNGLIPHMRYRAKLVRSVA